MAKRNTKNTLKKKCVESWSENMALFDIQAYCIGKAHESLRCQRSKWEKIKVEEKTNLWTNLRNSEIFEIWTIAQLHYV